MGIVTLKARISVPSALWVPSAASPLSRGQILLVVYPITIAAFMVSHRTVIWVNLAMCASRKFCPNLHCKWWHSGGWDIRWDVMWEKPFHNSLYCLKGIIGSYMPYIFFLLDAWNVDVMHEALSAILWPWVRTSPLKKPHTENGRAERSILGPWWFCGVVVLSLKCLVPYSFYVE